MESRQKFEIMEKVPSITRTPHFDLLTQQCIPFAVIVVG